MSNLVTINSMVLIGHWMDGCSGCMGKLFLWVCLVVCATGIIRDGGGEYPLLDLPTNGYTVLSMYVDYNPNYAVA